MEKESYELFIEISRIFQSAVTKEKKRNKELGLANVFEKDGKLFWELPDGTVTDKRPEFLNTPYKP